MAGAWTLAVLWAGALWTGRAWLDADVRGAILPAGVFGAPGPELGRNALRSAGAAGFAAAFLFICDAGGRVLLRGFGRPRVAPALAGWLALGTGLLGVAAAGLWRPAALWGALALFALAARPGCAAAAAGWRRGAAGVWRGLSPAGRGAAVLLAGWAGWLLTPPEVTFDPLSYDLAYPQQLLVTGRLVSTDVWSHWLVPLPAEFPYVFALLAGADSAARMIAPGLAAAGVLAGWRALAPSASPRASAVVVLAALVLPAARSGLVTSKSDAVAIGCAAAAAGALFASGAFGAGRLRAGAFGAGALLLGAAVAVKFLLLPLAAVLAAACFARRPPRDRPAAALMLALGCALPILPWLARAWLAAGDPLPPIGWALFPALAPDPEQADRTRRMFTAYVRDQRRPAEAPVEALAMLWTNAWPLLAALPLVVRASGPVRALVLATAAGYAGMVLGIRGAIEHVERFCHPAFTILLLVAFSGVAGAPRVIIRSARWPVAIGVATAVAGLGRFEWWPGGALQARQAAYHLGRVSGEGMRRDAMLAYGAILPRLRSACFVRPGRSVLAVGEFQFWDVPARVRTWVFEPPLIWRAARDARTTERIGVRLRQANAGLLLHNQYLADWSRHTDAPYGWDGRMLGIWMAYAARHLEVLSWSGRIDPHYGGAWLYAVHRRARRGPARQAFLPGIEPGLAFASLAAANGDHAAAVGRFESLARTLPGLAHLDALRGSSLLRLGRAGPAYALLKRAGEAGVVTEWSLLELAVAAARTGRRVEGEAALRRAATVLPLWPARIAEARRRMERSAD